MRGPATRRNSRNPIRACVVAIAVATMAITTAVPGSAAPTPEWPASGYLPMCNQVSLGQSANTFIDTSAARVVSVFGPRYYATGNKQSNVHLSITAADTCSGVGSVHVIFNLHSPAFGGQAQSQQSDAVLVKGTPWNGEWRIMGQLNASFPLILDVAVVGANDRYRSFDLDPATNTLIGTPTPATTASYQWTQQFRGVRLRFFPRTALSISPSTRTLARGSRVTIRGVLDEPNGTGISPLVNCPVALQRRFAGSTKWRTVRSGRTSKTGAIAFGHSPTKTSYYRIVYVGSDATYTLSVTSGVARVRLR